MPLASAPLDAMARRLSTRSLALAIGMAAADCLAPRTRRQGMVTTRPSLRASWSRIQALVFNDTLVRLAAAKLSTPWKQGTTCYALPEQKPDFGTGRDCHRLECRHGVAGDSRDHATTACLRDT